MTIRGSQHECSGAILGHRGGEGRGREGRGGEGRGGVGRGGERRRGEQIKCNMYMLQYKESHTM